MPTTTPSTARPATTSPAVRAGSALAVEATGLTRRFGDVLAVDDVDLAIPSGGVVGFVGPNGSGKSTTIRMLLGLVRPTAGTGRVLGHPIEDPSGYAHRVGGLIENPAFVPTITARANLSSMAALRGVDPARVDDVLATVGLSARADDRVDTYSLGMKQRLAIAIALLGDPELLVLDEPTNGLDPAGIVEVRTLLRQLADEGRTVLVSSHLLAEVQAIADHVVLIRFGVLQFDGPLDELLRTARTDVVVAPERWRDHDRLVTVLRDAGLDVTWGPTGRADDRMVVDVHPDRAADVNRLAAAEGIVLSRLEPRRETLEQLFIRLTGDAERPAHAVA